jgi:adenine/guanine phosphoribosyltransferase-like PRPP-binding protein
MLRDSRVSFNSQLVGKWVHRRYHEGMFADSEAGNVLAPTRTPWPDGFPDADIHAPESRVKNHGSYSAAKAGDIRASLDLVLNTLDDTAVERLRQYAGAMIIPVHGLEGVSVNTIPMAMAVCLSHHLGLAVVTDVVQTTRAAHTGAKGWWRLQSHALFHGQVTRGTNYVLVDDFLGMGRTFANLRGYVEAKGGNIVHIQTLTGKPYSAKIALTRETLQALRDKHGNLESWWFSKFGYGFDALTESEARYLGRAEDADTIRARLAEAAREGDG